MIKYSELLEFIKSFNRDVGTFTQDELFQIGLKHKQLPQKEKSWSRLAKDVGYPGSPDSYRHFVNYRQKKFNFIENVAIGKSISP